jgi:2-polyprenyl-3-methyl-5-hydroxy-6-metoxy-1,4-benzoquinol methylase
MDTADRNYSEWKGWARESFGHVDRAEALYFAEEVRSSGFEGIRGLNVCEIGFGNGAFASWAREGGANYIGTEAIPTLVVNGLAAGLAVFDASVPLATIVECDSQDLVVALDVFEHLDQGQLTGLLKSVNAILRPGGRVLARVPSGDSPFSRAMQHGDLTHRLVLGSSAIRQLVDKAGLDVVCVREPAMPLRGLGLRAFLRRLAVVTGRRVIYPIVTNVLMGGGRPILTPDLVFVLEKP